MQARTRNRVVFLILRRMRVPLLVLIAVYAISVLGLVLLPGIDAEGRPYRLDFFHAFYIVTYTITTIGYGELPYSFSVAQRLWMVFSIYLGVIGWVYALGALIALARDPAFRQVLVAGRFTAGVRRLREPFYIVCGYGDTGSLVVHDMDEHGLHAVVVDIDPDRISELTLEDLSIFVPGLCADAGQPDNLLAAGLKLPLCAGIVALTSNDAVNLKVAITAKMLNPGLRVICRADTHDTEVNMRSFGTDAVINPFDAFAKHLAMAVHSPDLYLLYSWLTQTPGQPLPLRYQPPRGTWLLCGYGRFGKAVQRHLNFEGVETVIIENEPEMTKAPKGTIHGRGTEAVTLREAHIDKAVGIVAGTDDDANNLSIIVTARSLNPNLFQVARQNARENDALFEAARLDLVMQRSRIISNRILSRISTPLLTQFLREARHQSNDWVSELVDRLWRLASNRTPDLWTVELTPDGAPAVHAALSGNREVRLGTLQNDARGREQRLNCLALLLKRGEELRLLPDDNLALAPGDRILMCGRPGVVNQMQWALVNASALCYLQTGEWRAEGTLWRWLTDR
ncbi:MAG TPA: NAD-binding protein [Acidiferrobacterales bacterium]|nr:NAD-binding protein [Acidiferrobacterales bacterium]